MTRVKLEGTYYERNRKEVIRKANARYRRIKDEDPRIIMLQSAKVRAKKAGLEFDIQLEDIVIPTHCPVLGIELRVNRGQNAAINSPSLDRKDNSKGYVKGNVFIISQWANRMKCNMSLEDIRRLYEYAFNHKVAHL